MGVRDFKAPGSRAMAAYERSFQLAYLRWSKKFLLRETRKFIKRGMRSAIRKDDRKKYTGSEKELQKIFETFYLRGYSKSYRDLVKIGPNKADILEQVRFETTERAQEELSKVRIALYDSIRDYMAQLKRFQDRHDLPAPTLSFVTHQLLGIEAPNPIQWRDAPTPPSFRFRQKKINENDKGKKLRTFGTTGVNGATVEQDPYGLAARARMIARTELTQARNAASEEGLKQLGATYKMWLSFDDGDTRRSHRHIDGAVVPVRERFKWRSKQPGRYKGKTVEAMAPGSLTLPPAERINCRCTLVDATEAEFKAWKRKNPGKVIKSDAKHDTNG